MKAKILIVDDAPFIREVIREIIQSSDFQIVAEAGDGAESIQLALQHKPQIIIMDIVMPEKNGIEAAREILDHLPETKIIACSTIGDNDMMSKAIEAGCCDYVAKPFDKKQLLSSVMKALGEGSVKGVIS